MFMALVMVIPKVGSSGNLPPSFGMIPTLDVGFKNYVLSQTVFQITKQLDSAITA